MRIGLMPNIPDQNVFWGVQHMVQRHGQLDHAQTRAQVPARDGYRVDGFGPQLVGHGFQLLDTETFQVRRRCNGVEQRRFNRHGGVIRQSDNRVEGISILSRQTSIQTVLLRLENSRLGLIAQAVTQPIKGLVLKPRQ